MSERNSARGRARQPFAGPLVSLQMAAARRSVEATQQALDAYRRLVDGRQRQGPPQAQTPAQPPRNTAVAQTRDFLDRNQTAKRVAGAAALHAARAPGAARGAWHTVKDLYDTGAFLMRLQSPTDWFRNPPSQTAWGQLYGGARNLMRAAEQVGADPQAALDAAGRALKRQYVRLDPAASPTADTFLGEVRRNIDIGLNQGELAFDVGSLLYGAGELKAVTAGTRAAKALGKADDFLSGANNGLEAYFASPYDGMGHHTLARRAKLPALLGGGPVPASISDSPFFLLRPRDMTNGEFFKLHHQVDPNYWGGRVPARFGGGGWSARRLGWERYGPAGRLWYGTTGPMKATIGGGIAVGTGALVDELDGEEERR